MTPQDEKTLVDLITRESGMVYLFLAVRIQRRPGEEHLLTTPEVAKKWQEIEPALVVLHDVAGLRPVARLEAPSGDCLWLLDNLSADQPLRWSLIGTVEQLQAHYREEIRAAVPNNIRDFLNDRLDDPY